jgi:N-acetylglucosaminyldiphosphoundecaprenol N-acetyl-beta-D-mannosaminyltransferase
VGKVLPADFSRHVHCLLGLPFDAVDTDGALRRMRRAATDRTPCFISTPNLNFLIASQDDEAFRDSVIGSDLSVTDGMPLVWMARLLGIPLAERVAGSTLFERLRADAEQPLSVYFFGGPEGVADAACQRLNEEQRGLRCAGFHYPGMGSVEAMSSDEVIADINVSGADFLVVALGARKGQEWIMRNLPRLDIPLVSHLGAVVNFVAGTVSRAPRWMQQSGLEWLWRIKEEPGLWHRYLGDGLTLLRLLVTRVLPHAWYLRRNRLLWNALPAGTFTQEITGETLKLHLQGVWTERNLVALRREFSLGTTAGYDLQLDLGGVHYVDSAFIGLLLLLRGHQSRCARRLAIIGAHGDVARVFGWSGAGFLLAGEPASSVR